jgi:hypothetical protein
MHALGDAASLFEKLLGEREVGPTFVEESFPADSELIPSRLNRRRSLPCWHEQQEVILGLAECVTFRRRNSIYRVGGVHVPKRTDHFAFDIGEAKSVLADISFVGEVVLTECFAISSKLVRESLAAQLILGRKAIQPFPHARAATICTEASLDNGRNTPDLGQERADMRVE